MKHKKILISVFITAFCVVILGTMIYNGFEKKAVFADLDSTPVIIVDAGHAALENTID